MYDFWNAIAILSLLISILFQIPRFIELIPASIHKNITRRKIIIGITECVVIFISSSLLATLLLRYFADWFTHGNANYYGTLTAWMIVVTLLSLLFKINPLKAHDVLTIALPTQLFFAKLACFFHGCCSGFELPGSFYFNQKTGRYEFPVQLVEALVALALFFFLIWYKKRNKIPGSVFPMYIVLYSASRFLTEFLRADFPNVLGPFDAYQIMSFVFLLIGLLIFYFVWIFKYESEKAKSKKKHH